MSAYAIEWDKTGEREYEVGVDHVVLYPLSAAGTYEAGVAWNGFTGIDENPDGGDLNEIWADNIKYATFQTPENHKGTLKAFMFPNEFYPCNGMVSPTGMSGLVYGGQKRKAFGLCYRTLLGNDASENAGYKIHLVYNSKVQPSSRSHATKSENVDPEEMSWEYSSTPVPVSGVTDVEQTSTVEIKSTDFQDGQMAALLQVLYGTAAVAADATNGISAADAVSPRLPAPGEVKTILAEAYVEPNG